MTTLRRKFSDILIKAQIGTSQVQLKRLQNLYHETDFQCFLKEFLKCTNIILKTNNDQNPYRDKLLIFFSKFCTSLKKPTDDPELICPFLREIFLHLFKEYNPDVISPYRICQFIKLLLKEIGEQQSFLDDDICTEIRDLMLERIDDVKWKVRVEAIEVLQRLQDPLDNNDIIIKAFIDRLNDDNSQIRKHIVQCIGLNVISIPMVVSRCLDINDEVRLVSYDKLSKVPIKALKISQRQFILRNGFSDKSPKIQKFIIKVLLPQWLSTYNGDYFQLIHALKLDADEKDFKQTIAIVEKVLNAFFKNTEISTIMEALPIGKEKLISSGEVLWEEILFWRCLQQFLRNQEDEIDYVEKILPELVFFCDYVSQVHKSKSNLKSDWELLQHDHIMFELLKICHDYDYSDEVGRNALQNLVTTILIDGPALYDVTVLLMRMFEKFILNTEERATKICEIIAEIQTPMTPVVPSDDMIRKRDVKLAEFRCKLYIAEDNLEKAVDVEDYDKASRFKKEIADIKDKMVEITKEFDKTNVQRMPKTDTSTLCRCLDILTASLQNIKIKSLPQTYRAFQDIFLPPLLSSREPEIFWRALKQLCLFTAFDVKLAKQSMQVFCTPLLAHKFRPVYGDQTTVTAITCVTDVILIHGSGVFEEEDNMLNSSQRPAANKRKILDRTTIDETVCNEPPPLTLELVIEILSELLDDTDNVIRETAGECLITLILTGRVRSPLLFSKLLLKWFSPNTLKDVRLRQIIGSLFTDYTPESPYSLEVIEQAFLPTLQAIIDAPRSSPLADVDVESVARFLAALSQPGRHKYNVGLDAHKNIALILCKEICDRPNNKRTYVYLKTLLYLEPPREDEASLDILRKQIDIMQEVIKDKQSLRYVFKYRHKLHNNLSTITDNTTSTNSLNTVSGIPDSTSNVALETVNNTMETQKDDMESSRYSALSVKRKKRQSKETGNKEIHKSNESNRVLMNLDQNVRIEKVSSQMVISETDSDYATENDLERHKKKQHCTESAEQNTSSLNLNEDFDIRSVVELNKECNISGDQHKRASDMAEKELAVRLVRDEKIDKMCSEKSAQLSICSGAELKNYKHGKVNKNTISDKQLSVSLVRSEEVDKLYSQLLEKNLKSDTATQSRSRKKISLKNNDSKLTDIVEQKTRKNGKISRQSIETVRVLRKRRKKKL